MRSPNNATFNAVAFAGAAVKGLRSQSLAPINTRQKAAHALDCGTGYGWEVNKGAAAPYLKTGKRMLAQALISTMPSLNFYLTKEPTS
jgi:hypothetical protein